MSYPIILDNCVFRDGNFLNKLNKYHGRKIIPVIAYTELAVYFKLHKNKNRGYIDYFLGRFDIEIERMDANIAKMAVDCCRDGDDFRDNFRDYLIGAHSFPAPRTLITNNVEDFPFVRRKFEPYDFVNKYKL